MKILLVENDSYLAERLERALAKENYVVDLAQNGAEAEGLAETLDYDLVLTEVARPRIDGIYLCKHLRSLGKQMPIMLLTDEGDVKRQVAGLDAGADDYVVSPCDTSELLARIRALLRRGSSTLMEVLEWRKLIVDTGSCEVSYNGHSINLTRKEYGILELFMRNTRRIYSQSALLDLLWSFEEPPGENTVRAHIKSLRQKLKKAGTPADFIETVYGLGYRLRQPPEGEVVATPVTPTPAKTVSVSSPKTPAAEIVRDRLDPELTDIWEQAKSHIQERLATIELAISAIQSHTLTPHQQEKAHQQAHTLVGSLGALGLPKSSQLVRTIQQCLHPNRPLNTQTIRDLEQAYSDLQAEIENLAVGFPPNPPASPIDRAQEELNHARQLLIVDDDVDLAALVRLEAGSWGIQSRTANSIAEARDAIATYPPDVILLDLGFPDTAETGFTLLEELAGQNADIPVVVFTAAEDFKTRVKVARLGGQAFLQKPVLPRQVLEAISQILERGQEDEAKIVVVDSDPQILDRVRTMLQPWGFQLVLLDNPAQFWDTLVSVIPDLLILASEMPDIDGIDLCQVVRNDPQWGSLPVLFLADSTGTADVTSLFAAGGSDYVRKPISEAELVARVLSQLERTPGNSRRESLDPVTGVMGRRRSIREFTRLMYLANRHHQPLSLAVVQVRSLEEIEKCHGRSACHQVLKHVADELQGHLRQEDIVARWDADTFAICTYDMDRFNGIRRLSSILGRLQSEQFHHNGDEICLKFRCGIAEYGDSGHDLYSLYRSATQALASI